MSAIPDFGESSNVSITVLMDNRTDLLAKSTEEVEYRSGDPLRAEHGFAALVDLQPSGARILWDAGATADAVLENMKSLQIDPATIDVIAVSHGHDDHTTGLTTVLRAMERNPKPHKWEPDVPRQELVRYAAGRRVPVVLHPAAFRERWSTPADRAWYGPAAPPPRAEWQAAGAEIVLSAGPHRLAPGAWTTGMIPRASFETAGIPADWSYREGDVWTHDKVEDDQAIVVNVKDKGLVVLSGCAHAGIVNTVNYAREISGRDTILAVIGGFHLAKATDSEIQQTVGEMRKFRPRYVIPCHCSGFTALNAMATALPEAFRQGLVGMKFKV